MGRGRLIALEGIDGAGLSTQSAALVDRLKSSGVEAVLTKEPTEGAVGRLIRDVLSGRVAIPPPSLALLFAADRMDHVESVISPALDRGEVVVTDRYLLSSLAYQGLDLPTGWVEEINRFAPRPDLWIVLDADPEVALRRIRSRGGDLEMYESARILGRIRERFLSLAERFGAVVVDANRPVAEVALDVWRSVSGMLR